MLRAIELRRDKLIDPLHSNVIFVLTHFSGVPDRESTAKLARFKHTVKLYSKFSDPLAFVVAENKGAEEELRETRDGFVLSNGQIYPLNLFTEIKDRLEANGDSLGVNVITAAFKLKSNLALQEKTRTPLLSPEFRRTIEIFQKLTSSNFLIATTNVSKILAKTYRSLPRSVQRRDSVTLPYLQRVLHIRGIIEPSQLPRADYAAAALFRDIETRPLIYQLMKTAFKLEMSAAPFIHEKIIGYSYDSLEAKSLPITPFEDSSMEASKHSGILGFKIPNVLNCKPDVSQKLFLKNLKNNKASALEEYRLHSCELDLSDPKLSFSTYFKQRLNEVGNFNESNYESLAGWREFFREFGTHVVTSAYIGGSIDVLFNSDLVISNPKSSLTQLEFDSEHTLKITGGDFRFKTESLRSMFSGEIPSLFTKWKESLVGQSSVLTSELTLTPLHILVARILKKPTTEAVQIEIAANFFVKHKDAKSLPNDEELKRAKAEILELSAALTICNEERANYSRTVLKFQESELKKEISLKSFEFKLSIEQDKNSAQMSEINAMKQTMGHLRSQIADSDLELVRVKKRLRKCDSKADRYEHKYRICKIRSGDDDDDESDEVKSSSSEEFIQPTTISPIEDDSEETPKIIIEPIEDYSYDYMQPTAISPIVPIPFYGETSSEEEAPTAAPVVNNNESIEDYDYNYE